MLSHSAVVLWDISICSANSYSLYGRNMSRAVFWLSPLNVGNQPEAVSPSMAPKGGYRPTTDGRDWHGGDQTLHRFR